MALVAAQIYSAKEASCTAASFIRWSTSTCIEAEISFLFAQLKDLPMLQERHPTKTEVGVQMPN